MQHIYGEHEQMKCFERLVEEKTKKVRKRYDSEGYDGEEKTTLQLQLFHSSISIPVSHAFLDSQP